MFKQHTALKKHPSKLYVETTTSCNLGCLMCVKQTEHCKIAQGHMSPETFDVLKPALEQAQTLILNGVGETLLNDNTVGFISTARSLMPADSCISFQSNGLLIDDAKAAELLAAGLDKICISIDAVTPEKLEELRDGADLSQLERAFKALLRARGSQDRADFSIGVEIVAMRSNLAEIPATLKWAADHGATFAIVTNVLPYRAEHLQETLYEPCSKEATQLFSKWRSIASQQGVNLDRYPTLTTSWFLNTGDTNRKTLDYIDQLKQEAGQKNIILDLRKLFNFDATWIEKAQQSFSEALDVAVDNNLQLTFPELLLKEDRCCDFVEEGSAFISWNGEVHPCYFLWHGYHCFASGWEQMVQAKTFGNINQRPLLEIWNSQEFVQFRKNVINYDYPYCSSCSLAPCDYVQTENFEQDCHISAEPCGSCLWNMGLFQCLR